MTRRARMVNVVFMVRIYRRFVVLCFQHKMNRKRFTSGFLRLVACYVRGRKVTEIVNLLSEAEHP